MRTWYVVRASAANLVLMPAVLLVLVVLTASAHAQTPQEAAAAAEAIAMGKRVSVRVTGDAKEVEGILLQLGPDTVRIRVDGVESSFALRSIQRVDLRSVDSVLEGAILGGLAGSLWCGTYACAEARSKSRAVLGAAAVGALIGAAIDYSMSSRTTIYVGSISGLRSGPGLVVSFRVVF